MVAGPRAYGELVRLFNIFNGWAMVAGPRAHGELARLFNIFSGWDQGCRSKGLWRTS